MKADLGLVEHTQKHAAWMALSGLYLDTELSADDLKHIATSLSDTGYTWDEILEINYNEVAPALWLNMLSVAGEWRLWDKEWVIARIRACYTGSNHKLLGSKRLWKRQVDSGTADVLTAIAAFFIPPAR